ncbi:bifunctional 2-polyprenyl-6-hydroxyphenol methylase/3-demethylubiquinol 3-O-methyltransferase UbiG [methanotrophic endosymbiont of Bathymodiolus puteoserpentis (Logatchev)]|jgi:2-polyprenyl-6-hydroxyphenyl methylase/3-demethylubiquinone-9 3-methyltransferase|uniref:bifunctional 2-polyprenyl-6-hydroxyphenol methylase/3-demethylubiquinol 3-O-methyltransferase UbiG n=1 Tax=methanotrophic endosymbiont of Bathymodiolus puteoserpentis (Logatchev) TaxID=343235 RepID=UPI00086D7455|nr:bifunctional 2-polyprenyl-6-hydroxyphenol methylase/3-demethylubiquinol 3-O-methyltransferase UbiG [methanotrophic endosymbiont of Bathymodiolus puteoserpentis (Logatchev)]SCN47362.1 3-demethylubiquinone-9 3-methyltransferase [methanotrophic endosymbiont of Bathymodiolus azoricus (Menez Gwen)]SHE22360.1 3-demethylubiquinone-9 3-methyltransferase [methanotrophic endosymbiont of Bathymodiolus puteoserpentis (Logatchev)]
MTASENVHLHEINKFGSQAERWWDKNGEFKTLHDVNPLRINFIQKFINPQNMRIVDVGCGGGILTEGLAKKGANMLGIDLSEDLIDIADLHGLESGVKTHYQKISAEALAEAEPASFDHVVCMEMLEHVPEPGSVVAACAKMVKPGGYVFFSTLNRKPKAYLLAIVAAEHILKMLPAGTHDYKTFIKPSELSQSARDAGLELQGMTGIQYNPLTKNFSLSDDIDINYIAAFKRPE